MLPTGLNYDSYIACYSECSTEPRAIASPRSLLGKETQFRGPTRGPLNRICILTISPSGSSIQVKLEKHWSIYLWSVFVYPFFNKHLLCVYYVPRMTQLTMVDWKIRITDLKNLTDLAAKTNGKGSFTMNYCNYVIRP